MKGFIHSWKITSSLVFLLFSIFSRAQTTYQFLVQFKDKTNSTFDLSSPQAFLSEKAIERRDKHEIAITEEDLPIVGAYIDSIKSSNQTLRAKTKWFNAAVVSNTDSATVNSLAGFTFVSSIQFIGKTGINKKGPDKWNYGGADNQTEMVSGSFLHNKGYSGKGVMIAVIDVGFKNANSMIPFDSLYNDVRVVATWDFVEEEADVYDDPAHGSSVLSTMASLHPDYFVGSAPYSDYVLLVSEDANQENLIEEFNYIEALEYADSIGADIVNTALGYTDFETSEFTHTHAELTGDSAWASKGSNIAVGKGMLLVTSAGNSGNTAWRNVAFPGEADSVLTVGAVTSTGELAGLSSVGIPSVNDMVKPNVVLQGHQAYVVMSNGSYSYGNGTSFSAPQMAGWAACLMEAFPEKKVWEVKKAIEKSAHQYHNADSLMGYGIPDMKKAYHYLANISMFPEVDGFSIYPNPANCEIALYTTSEAKVVEIFDQRGKLVLSEEQEGDLNIVDVSFLNSGSYHVVIRSDVSYSHRVFVKY